MLTDTQIEKLSELVTTYQSTSPLISMPILMQIDELVGDDLGLREIIKGWLFN